MVLSKHIEIISLLLIPVILSGCVGSGKCTGTINLIDITDWNPKVPVKGVLYRYKKGTNFTILEQKNDSDFESKIINDRLNKYPYLEIIFYKYARLPTNSDYKLVLNENIETRGWLSKSRLSDSEWEG